VKMCGCWWGVGCGVLGGWGAGPRRTDTGPRPRTEAKSVMDVTSATSGMSTTSFSTAATVLKHSWERADVLAGGFTIRV
jgi:hypothetical protein